MDSKDTEIASLRTELDECVPIRFQQQSKEYEDALEQEITSKEKVISDLKGKVQDLQTDLKEVTARYHRCEADLTKAQESAKENLKELEKYRAEKRELELLNDDWERSKRYFPIRILEFSNQELEQKLNHAEEYMIMYKEELDELNSQNEVEIQRLKDQIKLLTDELAQVQAHSPSVDESQVKQLEEALQSAIEEKMKLKSELEKPKVNRMTSTIPIEFQSGVIETDLADSVGSHQDSEGEENAGGQTIRVFARVRKVLSGEVIKEPCITCTRYLISSTCIEVKTKDHSIKKTGRTTTKQFLFERVFDGRSSNLDVFLACENTIESVLSGGTICVLAYGQTGSGKTYTMRGLIEQSLETITQQGTMRGRLEISLQCIEVYNDLVRNLFTQESEGKSNKIKEFLVKATIPLLDFSTEAIWDLIAQANEARVTKYTDANELSSRSHLLITFFLKCGDTSGKLTFVDLAGSERLSSSNAKGDV